MRRFGGEQRLEDARQHVGVHARPVVDDREADTLVGALGPHGDAAGLALRRLPLRVHHRLRGVVDQVDDDLGAGFWRSIGILVARPQIALELDPFGSACSSRVSESQAAMAVGSRSSSFLRAKLSRSAI